MGLRELDSVFSVLDDGHNYNQNMFRLLRSSTIRNWSFYFHFTTFTSVGPSHQSHEIWRKTIKGRYLMLREMKLLELCCQFDMFCLSFIVENGNICQKCLKNLNLKIFSIQFIHFQRRYIQGCRDISSAYISI